MLTILRCSRRATLRRSARVLAVAMLGAGGLLSVGCSQQGEISETIPTVEERDLSAVPGPIDAGKLRPVERVPRAQFGEVGQAPHGPNDVSFFAFPSLDENERASLLEGLDFFSKEHTAAEGLGPVNNQNRCMGCHQNSDEAVPGLLQRSSHLARAARSTPTNFNFTSYDPATGSGRAPDHLDALSNTGKTAAFSIFGNYSPAGGTFEPLLNFGGFVQHVRPSLAACRPDPILPLEVDPVLRGGIDPATGLTPLGLRRSVAERAGPPYIGRGLMEAIPAEHIAANDDPLDVQDHNSSMRATVPRFDECPGDCVSGRHNEGASTLAFVGGDPVIRLARFGLRAAGPTILQFVVGGMIGELGFTSQLTPSEPNNPGNIGVAGCDDLVPDPEVPLSTPMSLRQLVRLTALPEFGDPLLQVLRAGDPEAPQGGEAGQVQRGASLFGVDLVAFANRMIPGRLPAGGSDGRDARAINQRDRGVNCVGCHTPVQTTGQSPAAVGGRHLSNVWVPLFSDLILHEGPEVTPERIAPTPRNPVEVVLGGFRTFDLPRNMTEDALIGLQGLANSKEFRTPPLMGIGRVGPPFLHDARVYLSRDTRDSFPASTVFSNSEVTNAPLVVRSLDDALRAAIELHDLPAPDDARTPANGGCPLPPGGRVGFVRYASRDDICPPYRSPVSLRNRSEAREVIRRFRALTPADQQALIEFLKQL